jgi:hypothetical protein
MFSWFASIFSKFLRKRGENLIRVLVIYYLKIIASLGSFINRKTPHQLKGHFDLHNFFKLVRYTFFYEGGVAWLSAN